VITHVSPASDVRHSRVNPAAPGPLFTPASMFMAAPSARAIGLSELELQTPSTAAAICAGATYPVRRRCDVVDVTYVQEEMRELLNEKELQLTAVQRAHGQLEAELAAATHAAAGGRGVQDDDTAMERQLTVAARVEELNSRIGELRSVVAKREASAKKHKEHVRPATFLSPLYISHTLPPGTASLYFTGCMAPPPSITAGIPGDADVPGAPRTLRNGSGDDGRKRLTSRDPPCGVAGEGLPRQIHGERGGHSTRDGGHGGIATAGCAAHGTNRGADRAASGSTRACPGNGASARHRARHHRRAAAGSCLTLIHTPIRAVPYYALYCMVTEEWLIHGHLHDLARSARASARWTRDDTLGALLPCCHSLIARLLDAESASGAHGRCRRGSDARPHAGGRR
jgi:hypothetical protein